MLAQYRHRMGTRWAHISSFHYFSLVPPFFLPVGSMLTGVNIPELSWGDGFFAMAQHLQYRTRPTDRTPRGLTS